MSVRCGTLNGDPGIRPSYHAFVASKVPWVEICDGLAPLRRRSDEGADERHRRAGRIELDNTSGAGRRLHMNQQVARLSPHQNGKVVAVLMAVTSLIFIIPFFVFFGLVGPAGSRPPLLMMLLMPILYLVIGYVSVAIGCALYNFLYRYIGGFEYEATTASGDPR